MFKSYDEILFFSFFSKQEELYPDDPSVSQERRNNRQVHLLQTACCHLIQLDLVITFFYRTQLEVQTDEFPHPVIEKVKLIHCCKTLLDRNGAELSSVVYCFVVPED